MNTMDGKRSGKRFRNPYPTVDIVIELKTPDGREGIVLIERKNPPPGWALPGGFVDYGESLEEAAVREAAEETSLKVKLLYQLHTYSDPRRDPRKHTITTVYIAKARGNPRPQDDARDLCLIDPRKIDRPLAFDHEKIIKDYLASKRGKRR